MQTKIIRWFLYSAGTLLFLTGIAKWISAGGGGRLLQTSDPLLSISYQKLFWAVGAFELAVALFCFIGRRADIQAGLVAWLATNFVIYRLGLVLVGYHGHCSCLGNLTDALPVSPETADAVMKTVLLYLLVGSYSALTWLWTRGRKRLVPVPGP